MSTNRISILCTHCSYIYIHTHNYLSSLNDLYYTANTFLVDLPNTKAARDQLLADLLHICDEIGWPVAIDGSAKVRGCYNIR